MNSVFDSRVFDFSKGKNRKVATVASFLLILYCLSPSVMCVRPSKQFADGFHVDPFPDELICALIIRFFSGFRCQIRSTTLLHKLIRSALMVLETLASLFVVCGLLPETGSYIWAKYTSQIEPDPDAQLERLVLALAVWVVVSALYRRIRGRNSGLSKLMQSAVIVLTYSLMLNELDRTVVGGTFVIWLAVSVLGLDLWIEATGGTEHLREWGMSLFGHPVLLDETNLTWPMAVAVWIGLSAFYGICETLLGDRTDTAPKEVASSSSISTLAKKEVRAFLSVNRGQDVRDEFIDLLLVQLKRSGISVYGDGGKLPKGEELVEVIKRSKISVPIISKGYASSKSCLMELCLMLECRRTNGQMIIPIFYKVDPLDVRQVRGSFEISLKEHEIKGTDGRTIDAWGRALREVGGLKKIYSADKNYGYDCKLVEQLVLDVLQLLRKSDTGVKETLVGIKGQIQEFMTKLGVSYRDGQSVRLRGGDV